MTATDGILRASTSTKVNPNMRSFLKWQCRVRQMAVRERAGRPDEGMSPTAEFPCGALPTRSIVTVICRKPEYSKTPELRHIAKRSNDPAQRREDALTFFAADYYQQPSKFSDTLVASFLPDSAVAARIAAAGSCILEFRAYSQRYKFECAIRRLEHGDSIREAAWQHNLLFNPGLRSDAMMLGFYPDWHGSIAESAPPTAVDRMRGSPMLFATASAQGGLRT